MEMKSSLGHTSEIDILLNSWHTSEPYIFKKSWHTSDTNDIDKHKVSTFNMLV